VVLAFGLIVYLPAGTDYCGSTQFSRVTATIKTMTIDYGDGWPDHCRKWLTSLTEPDTRIIAIIATCLYSHNDPIGGWFSYYWLATTGSAVVIVCVILFWIVVLTLTVTVMTFCHYSTIGSVRPCVRIVWYLVLWIPLLLKLQYFGYDIIYYPVLLFITYYLVNYYWIVTLFSHYWLLLQPTQPS